MLRDQYRTLPFPVFERLHLNRFPSSGTNRAYPAAWWHAAAGGPALRPGRPTRARPRRLAGRATRRRSSWTSAASDGRHHLWAQVWRKDAAMGHIDHEAVEAKIVELCAAYNVVRIGCDPNYFTRSMLRLEHEFRPAGRGVPAGEQAHERPRR